MFSLEIVFFMNPYNILRDVFDIDSLWDQNVNSLFTKTIDSRDHMLQVIVTLSTCILETYFLMSDFINK